MTEASFSRDVRHLNDGCRILSFEDGYLSFPGNAKGVVSSSGRKMLYRGCTYTFSSNSRSRKVPAIVIYFITGDPRDYFREVQGLAEGNAIGVGAGLIRANVYAARPDSEDAEETLPLIIEEDAGACLEDVLGNAPIPCSKGGGRCLLAMDQAFAAAVSNKIAFDLIAQVANCHSARKAHRDVRTANVAVRCHGDGSNPQDYRATLIDLEFLSGKPEGKVVEAGYYEPLFVNSSWQGDPTPYEQDAGYLTLALAEVFSRTPFTATHSRRESVEAICRQGTSFLALRLSSLLSNEESFFSIESQFARLIQDSDAAALAEALGMPTVEKLYGDLSHEAVAFAKSISKRCGYVDTYDKARIEDCPEIIIEKQIDSRLAQMCWDEYNKQRRANSHAIEYSSFEDQPSDLIDSTRDQARSMRRSIANLGLSVTLTKVLDKNSIVVERLSTRQIEFIARSEHDRWMQERLSKGWTLGPRNHASKTSPYLVPWSSLEESVKEYDRAFARSIVPAMASAGLSVVK